MASFATIPTEMIREIFLLVSVPAVFEPFPHDPNWCMHGDGEQCNLSDYDAQHPFNRDSGTLIGPLRLVNRRFAEIGLEFLFRRLSTGVLGCKVSVWVRYQQFLEVHPEVAVHTVEACLDLTVPGRTQDEQAMTPMHFLLQFPNLKVLQIAYGGFRPPDVWTGRLVSLRHFDCHGLFWEEFFFDLLAAMPNLETITARLSRFHCDGEPPLEGTPKLLNLTKMRFFNTFISQDTFDWFFKVAKGLRILEYHENRVGGHFWAKEFKVALQQAHATLEVLEILPSYQSSGDSYIGPLVHFPKLRRIRTDICLLSPNMKDTLPPTIVEIFLTSSGLSMMGRIMYSEVEGVLSAKKGGSFPHLNTIGICTYRLRSYARDDQFEQLGKVCEDVGVKLLLCHTDYGKAGRTPEPWYDALGDGSYIFQLF
ncbi:hypothetical protein FN846DRAFT_994762 [Sphaerosporella brunnea]|uniref:Uncharacterized protein n=1 Tax=Sphaerosporella brunnea TaxID=1250544 RepID=A0A5J5ELL1_9PEZI|nr:hypothetical protein FN846DRAFT_994762 [Sphaerosporella brunnea]